MTIWKQTRVISFMIPEELLAMMDHAANKKFMSRSDYIRQLVLKDAIDSGVAPNQEHYEQPGEPNPAWLDIQ